MPSRVAKGKVDRRESIADAAIEVLAEIGLRGLTHRAVDSQLALAAGSTSYYFRTREALVTAAATRVFELDQLDMNAALEAKDSAKRLLERWLSPNHRSRLVARYTLFVESSRRPDEQPLAVGRTAFISNVAHVFEKAGVEGPRAAAVAMIAMMDGLLLNELLGTSLTRAERARAIDAILIGLTHKRQRSDSGRRGER